MFNIIYNKLFESANKKSVKAGLIGTGHYGTAVLTQSIDNPYLKMPVIVDKNIEAAKTALSKAGINEEQIELCSDNNQILNALEKDKYIIVEDAELIMDTPLDVIIEGTGSPEAGARNAYNSIKHGKHVAMINKETDSVVGPILNYLAKKEGVVYTPVDGDQHGLLIGMINWAKTIGLKIIAAGKAINIEVLLNENKKNITLKADGLGLKESIEFPLDKKNSNYFNIINQDNLEYLNKRKEIFNHVPTVQPYDLCEMTIVSNSTGLIPDKEDLHRPVVKIKEIPEILCSNNDTGILSSEGVVDIVTTLRRPDEPGLGGGVFIVVTCDNDYSREILVTKGLISNTTESAALIFRPYHLCGVETSTSILSAGLLGLSTGSEKVEHNSDMIRVAKEDISAGEIIGDDHDKRFEASIIPAIKEIKEDVPVPAHMLNGLTLKEDAKAGDVITLNMIKEPEGSFLWNLRKQQEKIFIINQNIKSKR